MAIAGQSPVLNRINRYTRPVYMWLPRMLDQLGIQLSFYFRAIAWIPRTLRRYKKEVLRLLAEVSLGSGALAVAGGTFGVILFLSFFTGTQVGLELYKGLQAIGAEAFSGLSTAYGNTREIAPLIAGVALAAQVGCGFTAQLGAMRISEEVDALEVMGIPSLPFLVTTRIIAAFIAVMPLYFVGLISSFFASRVIVTGLFGQSQGTYDHYFHLFLPPIDVLYSLIKVAVFAVIITLIHCYYGYYASGGPEGVGVAVGKAIRSSIVAVNAVNLFLSLALWGANQTVRIAG
jgi:phospholipid/cholesterol/gamma-HCH transport system permease protein